MIRRIHTTYDLLEAHLITAMLREHDIDAWLFDADFVRQDWFKAIAYGGYRIMVSDDTQIGDAREILREYKNGTLALPDEHRLVCPRCNRHSGNDDLQPRRNTFAGIVLLYLLAALGIFHWAVWRTHTVFSFAVWGGVTLVWGGVTLLLPWIAIGYFKWPSRCDACGHRWREPRRYHHGELAKMAESGEQVAPE